MSHILLGNDNSWYMWSFLIGSLWFQLGKFQPYLKTRKLPFHKLTLCLLFRDVNFWSPSSLQTPASFTHHTLKKALYSLWHQPLSYLRDRIGFRGNYTEVGRDFQGQSWGSYPLQLSLKEGLLGAGLVPVPLTQVDAGPGACSLWTSAGKGL